MRISATQSENINKKISGNEFWIENSINRSYTRSRFGKIDVIVKNEAFNVFFSQIMDDAVGTEAKMTHVL